MRKVFMLLLVGVIVLAGCMGGSRPTDSGQNNSDVSGGEPTAEEFGEAWAEWRRTPGGTMIYENETENTTVRIEADPPGEVYDLLMTINFPVKDNEFWDRRDYVEFTSNLTCAMMAQITYNYTDVIESLEESNFTTDSTPDTAQDIIHERIYRNYTPRNVNIELYNLNGSTKLAECDIESEDELNREIYVGE